jgi:hypothetical protein
VVAVVVFVSHGNTIPPYGISLKGLPWNGRGPVRYRTGPREESSLPD